MKKLLLLGLIIAGSISISCKDQSENTSNDTEAMSEKTVQKANLIDGSWEVNYMAATPKPMDSLYPRVKPTMIINTEKSQISGTTGCNNFSGSLNIDGNQFNLGDAIALTKKMCPDMTGEEAFMKNLERVDTYSVTEKGQTLNLISGDIAIMRLERKKE
ncbi:META domain-containing protein [Gramella sp. GC03-9]|uniref:META domain-containing protein n=1 Tax=Christiangramia oceanisediminis TaxID=2920386 RepID=A0A9X2KWU2_9FLAO|nr:META domain-containing protein [Gramella oceanisediminis]MCP9199964.1 META domain-containing protein [Gramella oceanisediminis]